MSSSIYNHRNLQPAASGQQPMASAARILDMLDGVKSEFEMVARDNAALTHQRDEYESKVSGQVSELNIIRQSLYDLETTHNKLRLQYEEEIRALRAELSQFRSQAASVPPSSSGPPPPPPGHTQIPPGLGGPPLAGPQPMQGVQPTGSSSYGDSYGSYSRRDADRDRDRLDRERDRDRDTKRTKPIDKKEDHYHTSSRLQSSPQQQHPGPYPSAPTSASTSDHQLIPSGAPMVPDFPGDLDPQSVPADLKKEGSDWFALFNPNVKRTLDVTLTHTFLHESVVCCVRFSHDGKYLATGCNRTAQIFDTKTGAKITVLADDAARQSGDLYIRSVCFSPDGKYLATGAEDKQIRIWDIAKRRIRNLFEGHTQEIYSLDFSQDGRLIVSGSGDKTARIWDMETRSCKVLAINEAEPVDAGVTSVAISPNGRLVAAGSLDTIVRIWDVETGALVERLRGHSDSVYSVAFTPDGKGLVSGSLDKSLKYWDLTGIMRGADRRLSGSGMPKEEKKSKCTMSFVGHKDYVLSVAVSNDGQWVVSGSKDRGVQFWDSRTAQPQLMLQGHKNSVISIDLSPAGGILATGSGDWQARLWSYNTV